jgi:DNA-directed RNA polymerase subunit beta'
MLKGKGGRFRQNLLGKRVDYSGRSVIVIGQSSSSTSAVCRRRWRSCCSSRSSSRLKERGYVHTVRSAKKMIERQTPEVGTSWKRSQRVTRSF